MPLDDSLPQIDDRRYDDIVEEIRTRIARYAPEWTPGVSAWNDLNDNDPGVTLVQVFAWLAEMLTYRMNQVPQLNYVKFLQLIGIELRPAEPALAEIEFPIKDSHSEAVVLVPARTQVTAESGEGGPPIVFETDRALTALRAKLTAVQAYYNGDYSDVTTENTDAERGFYPFGEWANDGSALVLGFTEKDNVFPEAGVDLAIWILPDPASSSVVSCHLPDTPSFAPARLTWEYLDGSDWRPLSLLKDETKAFTRSGHVHLKTPGRGSPPMQPVDLPNVQEKLYWMRARLERSQYERPPKLQAIRTNTVPARQAETIKDEVLGGSNGRRDQKLPLQHTPVIHDTLQLEVDEGIQADDRRWARVDDFLGSGPEDKHYTLNRTSGEIGFGDGINGRIPTANVNNPDANIVAREYRVGGGRRGNVRAKAIKTLTTAVPGVDDNAVKNLFAAYGGRDEETLQEAKKRAPGAIRSRTRAVTAEDFEYFAKEVANIKRAKALPLHHPSFPDVAVPGVITVIVVPDGSDVPDSNGGGASTPTPSEGTLRAVCAHLDQKRLLTTELYVIKPVYQRVEIRADVFVEDDADLAEVKDLIEKALLTYFHPLKGGEPLKQGKVVRPGSMNPQNSQAGEAGKEDQEGEGWPFGGKIFYSRVYQRVFSVPGVQSIRRLVIVLDGEERVECQDVEIKEGALVYSTQHTIQVQYFSMDKP
jgi:predicted phage baseplate assembly protein